MPKVEYWKASQPPPLEKDIEDIAPSRRVGVLVHWSIALVHRGHWRDQHTKPLQEEVHFEVRMLEVGVDINMQLLELPQLEFFYILILGSPTNEVLHNLE